MRNAKKYKVNLNPKKKIGKNEIILLVVISSLFLGFIIGFVKCILIDIPHFNKLSQLLHNFFYNIHNINKNNADIVFESILKYGKILIIIWFLAFLPPASIVSVILIFVKGMSNGFATTLLIRDFGLQGFYYSLVLYLPQSLILIPTYIFASYSSINFTLLQISKNRANLEKTSLRNANRLRLSDIFFSAYSFEKNSFREYIMVLLIGSGCIVAIGFIEAYLIPYFIGNL